MEKNVPILKGKTFMQVSLFMGRIVPRPPMKGQSSLTSQGHPLYLASPIFIPKILAILLKSSPNHACKSEILHYMKYQ